MNCFRSPIVLSGIVVAVLYLVAALIFPPREMIEFGDGLAIAMSTAVVVVYGRRLATSICHQRPDIYDVLIIGIAGGWLTNAIDRLWRVSGRVLDRPEMMESHVLGMTLISLTFFAALHVLVKGSAGKENVYREVSSAAWSAIFVTLIVGSALGFLAISLDKIFHGGF